MSDLKILITGGPASGKTTLCRRIAATWGVPFFELDSIYRTATRGAGRPSHEMVSNAESIALQDRWVCEGVYMGWAEPLYREAAVIIFLEVPWRVASYRIIARHIKSTLGGNNLYPGLRRLYRFWQSSRYYYTGPVDAGLDRYGVPMTAKTAKSLLAPYTSKVLFCRNDREIRTAMAERFGAMS